MSKFSNNLTPSLLLEAQTETPALTTASGPMVAGQFRLFLQNGVLKLVDYQGNVTSQFPAGVMGSLFYQEADGSINSLPPGTTGQFLSIDNTGLPAWVAAPAGGGSSGGGVQTPLTFSADGDVNGLLYFLGNKQGGNVWTNPINTPVLTVTTNGTPWNGRSDYLLGIGDRLVNGQSGQYDTVIQYSATTGINVVFDLGTTYSLAPNKFCYRNRGSYNSDGTNAYASPGAMILEGSTDGVTYVTLATLTLTSPYTPGGWTDVDVSTTTSYRFLRVTKTMATGSESLFCIGELEFYGVLTTIASSGTPDAVLSGTAIASPPYSDMYAIAHINDGDTTSQYAGAGTSGQWAGLDFGAVKTLSKMAVFPRPGAEGDIQNGIIQTSTDGSTWTNAGFSVPGSIPENTYTYIPLSPAVSTRYIRILAPDGTRCSINELQCYGH